MSTAGRGEDVTMKSPLCRLRNFHLLEPYLAD